MQLHHLSNTHTPCLKQHMWANHVTLATSTTQAHTDLTISVKKYLIKMCASFILCNFCSFSNTYWTFLRFLKETLNSFLHRNEAIWSASLLVVAWLLSTWRTGSLHNLFCWNWGVLGFPLCASKKNGKEKQIYPCWNKQFHTGKFLTFFA